MHVREVQTCNRCRESKRRCDKAKPACSRCVRAGVPCSLDISSPSLSDACESNNSNDSQRSNGKLVSVDARRNSITDSIQPPHSISPSSRIIKKRDRACLSCTRCHRLKVKCDKLQPCNRCSRSGYKSTCIYTHKAPSAAQSQTPDSAFVLAGEDAETVVTTWFLRRRGSTHWRALLSRVEALEHVGPEVFATALREHSENKCLNDLYLPGNFPFGSPDSAAYCTIETVHSLVQNCRLNASTYLDHYLKLYQEIYPVLDIYDFQQQVLEFWSSPQQVDLNWFSQYLIVLGLGAFASNERHLAKDLFFAGEACLAKTPFMFRPSISNVSTLCLMVIAKQVANATCWALDSCWNTMGVVVRLAVMMGLDHDGVTLYRTNDITRERELHRRLWTIIVYLDIQLSLISGQRSLLPFDSLLADDDILPSNCMATLDDCWKSVLPESFPIICHFLGRINSSGDLISYDEVLQYDVEIRQRMRCLEGLEGSHILRLTLDIFFRRVLSCIHRFHALLPDAPSLYPTSYWSSLECSLALLVHHRALSERTGDFQSNYLLSRPFMLDFFAAALTAGVHLAGRDAPLSATLTSEGMMPPRQTIVDTLRSCLEIFESEKDESLCFRSGFRLLNGVCQTAWAVLRPEI